MSPIPPTPARRSDVKGPVPVGPVLTAIALLAPLVLGGAAQTYAADLSDLGSGATIGGQAVSIGGVEVPVPTATAVAAGEEQARTQQHVQQALLQLSAEERALVHLHYFEGLPLAEIASILAVSRDSLKMRLSRIRNKLRPLLGELDGSL